MSDPSVYDPATGTKIGRYRIEGRIAVGGMAEIFLARDPDGGRAVVKRLMATRESVRDRVKMFIHEGRVATLLDHENIVRVFEVDLDGRGSCYMAMEYLAGWDLEDVCYRLAKQGAYLPVPMVQRLMIDACRGLQAAHIAEGPDGIALELVHRDISPTNLFVNADGVLKILDFGIAKTALQTHHTQSGVVRGKPSYMSPEQIEARRMDHRSDIFSVGIVMHELLTGERLFWRENPLEVLTAITAQRVRPPTREGESLPPELVSLTMRALERDPDRRFFSAEQLADALEALGGVAERKEIADYLESMFHAQRAPEQISSATGSYLAISRWIDAGTDRILADSFASGSDEVTQTDAETSLPRVEPFAPNANEIDAETMIAASRAPLAEAVAAAAAARARRRKGLVSAAAIALVAGSFGLGALILGTDGPSPAPPPVESSEVVPSEVAPAVLAEGDENSEIEAGPEVDPGAETDVVTSPESEALAEPGEGGVDPGTMPSRASRRMPRKKRPTARKPGRPAVGRLSLSVNPWANVYYRGKLLGASPLVEHEFPAGRVELRFVNPAKGLEKTMTFNITAGEHLRDKVVLE